MQPEQFAQSPPRTRATQVRWLIFLLICATSWLLYLHRYSWGVIKPAFQKENPELTAIQLGWLDSAFLATYAIGQTPGGLVGDLFGTRAVLVIIILVWSLTVAALGWSNGFWPLVAMRSAFGMGQAGAYPVLNKVTKTWFPPAVRTSVQGIVTALGRVGGASAPPLVAALLMGLCGLSWRMSLLVIALPGVALALAFWLLFRNTPREHPLANEAEREAIEGISPTIPLPDVAERAPRLPPAEAAAEPSLLQTGSNASVSPAASAETEAIQSSPPLSLDSANVVSSTPVAENRSIRFSGMAALSLVMLLVYSFCSTFADQLYVFWIPSYLVQGKGLTFSAMGWFAPLPLLGGAVGGIVGGLLNDVLIRATGNPRWTRSGVAFTGKALAAVLIVASLWVPDGRLVMVLLLACKFFGDWSLPTQWGTVTDMAGKGAGTVFGVVNTVGSIGGFVAGPALGYLKHHYGWEGLFIGVGVAYVAAALTWGLIDCTRRFAFRET